MFLLIYVSNYDFAVFEKSDYFFAVIVFVTGPMYSFLFVYVNKNVIMEVISE